MKVEKYIGDLADEIVNGVQAAVNKLIRNGRINRGDHPILVNIEIPPHAPCGASVSIRNIEISTAVQRWEVDEVVAWLRAFMESEGAESKGLTKTQWRDLCRRKMHLGWSKFYELANDALQAGLVEIDSEGRFTVVTVV